jgi:hypothetical protein
LISKRKLAVLWGRGKENKDGVLKIIIKQSGIVNAINIYEKMLEVWDEDWFDFKKTLNSHAIKFFNQNGAGKGETIFEEEIVPEAETIFMAKQKINKTIFQKRYSTIDKLRSELNNLSGEI